MPNRRKRLAGQYLAVEFLACIFMTAGCPPKSHRYNLRGEVVAKDPGSSQITVKHDDVPGFMSAMTMVFPVKDGKSLDGVVLGEVIAAVVVTANHGMDYWLEDVRVVDRSGEKTVTPTSSPPEMH